MLITAEGEVEFRRILEIVKRKSQILDAITIIYAPNFWSYPGVAIYETTRETHTILG